MTGPSSRPSLPVARRTLIAAGGTVLGATLLSTIALAQGSGEPALILLPRMSAADAMTLAQAAPAFRVIHYSDSDEMLAHAAHAEIVYGTVSEAFVRAAPRLRWVQSPNAGIDDLLAIPALAGREVAITDMRGVMAPQVADHAIALLLALTRALPAFMARQVEREWAMPRLPAMVGLSGRTMLIAGLGANGRGIANRATGFGVRILATDFNTDDKPAFVERLEKPDAFARLLPEADIVVSAVPLTPQTRHLIAATALNRMKPGGYVINISRGGVVDGAAIVAALESGRLAGAALDVFDPEPIPRDHAIWTAPNVILTPHVAQQAPPDDRMIALFKDNLIRFVQGQPLRNLVDRRRGF